MPRRNRFAQLLVCLSLLLLLPGLTQFVIGQPAPQPPRPNPFGPFGPIGPPPAPEEVKPPDIEVLLAEIFDNVENSFNVEGSQGDGEKLLAALNSALLFEQRKMWPQALKDYYSIIDGDKDFLTRQTKIDGERVYTGIKAFCRRRVAEFPPDGAHAFRLTFDADVKRRLQSALDALNATDLALITRNYPLSDYADDAAFLAAAILFEQTKFDEALSAYLNFIEQFPDTDLPLCEAYARLAACARALGTAGWLRVADRLKAAPQPILDKQIRVSDGRTRGGASLTLRQYVDRTELLLKPKDPGARPVAEINPAAIYRPRSPWLIERLSSTIEYDASISGDSLIVSFPGGIALPPEKPKPGAPRPPASPPYRIKVFSITSGIQTASVIQDPAQKLTTSILRAFRNYIPSTVSADDGAIYYIDVSQRTTNPAPRGNSLAFATDLYACNSKSGKIIWSQPSLAATGGNAGGVPDEEAKALLEYICLTGAPVRSGSSLYAAGVKPGNMSAEFHVLCFDAKTGVLKWRRLIGSVSTELQPLKPIRTSSSQISVPGSRLAVAGNSVFFTSNMGVVGSIDAANGDIRWLAKYSEASQPEPANKLPREETVPQFIWHETPPKIVLNQTVTIGGKQTKANVLYVAPRDSDRLYAFNADTGARIWERCLADNVPLTGDASDYRRVVFSDDFALVLQNVPKQTDAAAPIDAEKYAPRRIMLFELATGREIDFNCSIPDVQTIACAPAFSGRYVFVATDKSLFIFDAGQNAKTAATTLLTNLVDINPLREIRLVGNKLLLFNEERVYCYSLAP